MRYEICNMIVFGTQCITKHDIELLEEHGAELGILSRGCGWAIYVDCYEEELEYFEGFSDAFMDLLRIAKEQNCIWLMLDCDGSSFGQPEFDW